MSRVKPSFFIKKNETKNNHIALIINPKSCFSGESGSIANPVVESDAGSWLKFRLTVNCGREYSAIRLQTKDESSTLPAAENNHPASWAMLIALIVTVTIRFVYLLFIS